MVYGRFWCDFCNLFLVSLLPTGWYCTVDDMFQSFAGRDAAALGKCKVEALLSAAGFYWNRVRYHVPFHEDFPLSLICWEIVLQILSSS